MTAFPNQPIGGRLPTMWEVGPSDLRYSSSTAPAMQTQIDRAHGRHLAGTDDQVQDEAADQGMAKNELDYYAQMDDVQGAGVFDPPGSHGNIHPDAGIFTARFDVPGYLARERFNRPSEVIDATTGRPTIYVNGGAVAMDDSARVAFIENDQYQTPQPVLDSLAEHRMPGRSTVNVQQNPQAIGAVSQPMSGIKLFAITAAVGLAAGAAYAAFRKKK
jgi:hypothetical protein